MLTPHVAALTETTYRAVCLRTVRNLLAYLRGGEPETGTIYRL
jgi:lactate dehydrogenase-like 2-hydroxyacid dehydrogenase